MIIDPIPRLTALGYKQIAVNSGFHIYENGPLWSLVFTNPTLLSNPALFNNISAHAVQSLHRIADVFYHGPTPLTVVAPALGRGSLDLGNVPPPPAHLHDLQKLGEAPDRWHGELTYASFLAATPWHISHGTFPPGPGGGYWQFMPAHWFNASWNLLPAGIEGNYRTIGHRVCFELFVPATPHRANYRISLVRNLADKQSPEVTRIRDAVNAGLLVLRAENGEHTEALCKWWRPDHPGGNHLSNRVNSRNRICHDLLTVHTPYTPSTFIQKWLSTTVNLEAVACLTNLP